MKKILFDIAPKHAPALIRARIRLERAEDKCAEADALHEAQGPEAHPKLIAAIVERRRAQAALHSLEAELLRAAR